MYKVDLHTHSLASPDGSLDEADYRRMLESGGLDCIAVTDHNTVAFAQKLHDQLGERIIVGEEITTLEGELVGLYLKETVKPGMPALQTADAIKAQGGLVYVPHPFETLRKGLSLAALEQIAGLVDIIEIRNGRAVFQNKGRQAEAWAAGRGIPGAASSDAHGRHGWGKTYSVLEDVPTRTALTQLLVRATYHTGSPGLRGVLYPKFNRIRRRRRRA